MIKIVASHSLKVPAEGEYSSKSFHLGLEAEVADTVGGEGILAKSHALFALARAAVNAELNGKITPARCRRFIPMPSFPSVVCPFLL